MASNIVTADRVRELFNYDPRTGIFTRLVCVNGKAKTGDVAGCPASGGYLRISVDGRTYAAHRLAWLYIHGVWPSAEIDHINCQPADNRLNNLRECSRSENMQNSQRARSSNKASGLLGVSWDERKGRWRAEIAVKGKRHRLGRFATPELAHAAYILAKRQLHPMGML